MASPNLGLTTRPALWAASSSTTSEMSTRCADPPTTAAPRRQDRGSFFEITTSAPRRATDTRSMPVRIRGALDAALSGHVAAPLG